MANVRRRISKDGMVSFQIRVFRGKDASGREVAPFSMTWAPDPTWKQSTVNKELARVTALFEEKCRTGKIGSTNLTFEEYANYVIDTKEASGLKFQTIARYRKLLNRLLDPQNCGIGYMKLKDIKAFHLNTLYRKMLEKGQNHTTGGFLSAKTVLEHHRLISTVLQQAVDEDLLPSNVATKAKPPRQGGHEAGFLEMDELHAIMEAGKKEPLKWQAILHLLIATGGRRGEILGLRWTDIDMSNRVLHFCNNLLYSNATDKDGNRKGVYASTLKTRESRYVSVAPEVLELLQKWKDEQNNMRLFMGDNWQETGYVFTQENGTPVHPTSLTTWCQRFSASNNLPHLNPHKFRHTQASLLINAGIDIVTVSKRLGHASISTTENFYAHALRRADAIASEAVANVLYKKSEDQETP